MRPTIAIDSREWKRAAQELFRTSSRSCVDFTNGQALKVAIEAVRQTRRASAAKIRAELNTVQSGQKATFAQRILAKRFRVTGSFGVKGSTWNQRLKNFIAARARSATFIASGWLPARKRLFAFVKQKPLKAGSTFAFARQYGREKGSARPATFSGLRSLITAEIANTALKTTSKYPAPGGDPLPVAKAGLQAALDIAAKDMIETLARRLNKDLAKFTRRV